MPVGGAPPVNPDEVVGALLANPLVATLKVDHTFGKIPEHTERYKIQQPPVSQPELVAYLVWSCVVATMATSPSHRAFTATFVHFAGRLDEWDAARGKALAAALFQCTHLQQLQLKRTLQ